MAINTPLFTPTVTQLVVFTLVREWDRDFLLDRIDLESLEANLHGMAVEYTQAERMVNVNIKQSLCITMHMHVQIYYTQVSLVGQDRPGIP